MLWASDGCYNLCSSSNCSKSDQNLNAESRTTVAIQFHESDSTNTGASGEFWNSILPFFLSIMYQTVRNFSRLVPSKRFRITNFRSQEGTRPQLVKFTSDSAFSRFLTDISAVWAWKQRMETQCSGLCTSFALVLSTTCITLMSCAFPI